MADTPWKAYQTRQHWAGADSNKDEHLEIYQNEVLTRFEYNAIFRGLSTQRSVANQSNTYRIDRLGTSQVKGRKSGETLDPQKVTNEKLLITVDTVLYIRNPIDWQDDWTAPDFLMEMATNNGYAFAEMFDEAHAIQLIKARAIKTPEHLHNAIGDGIELKGEFKADAKTQAELEANAIAINLAHKKAVDTLIKNKVPMGDMVTLVDTDIFSALLEHPKLLNLQFDTTNGGAYGDRRFVRMNGIPVVEVQAFPKKVYASGAHPLGASYDVSAEDLKCKMVLFSKSQTLVTVEAHPFESNIWEDNENFQRVLDCYCMYNVGVRRPDCCVVVKFSEPA